MELIKKKRVIRLDNKIGACLRCGRKLKTSKSIEQGFGPVCFKKHKQEQAEEEFRKNQMTMDQVFEEEHVS